MVAARKDIHRHGQGHRLPGQGSIVLYKLAQTQGARGIGELGIPLAHHHLPGFGVPAGLPAVQGVGRLGDGVGGAAPLVDGEKGVDEQILPHVWGDLHPLDVHRNVEGEVILAPVEAGAGLHHLHLTLHLFQGVFGPGLELVGGLVVQALYRGVGHIGKAHGRGPVHCRPSPPGFRPLGSVAVLHRQGVFCPAEGAVVAGPDHLQVVAPRRIRGPLAQGTGQAHISHQLPLHRLGGGVASTVGGRDHDGPRLHPLQGAVPGEGVPAAGDGLPDQRGPLHRLGPGFHRHLGVVLYQVPALSREGQGGLVHVLHRGVQGGGGILDGEGAGEVGDEGLTSHSTLDVKAHLGGVFRGVHLPHGLPLRLGQAEGVGGAGDGAIVGQGVGAVLENAQLHRHPGGIAHLHHRVVLVGEVGGAGDGGPSGNFGEIHGARPAHGPWGVAGRSHIQGVGQGHGFGAVALVGHGPGPGQQGHLRVGPQGNFRGRPPVPHRHRLVVQLHRRPHPVLGEVFGGGLELEGVGEGGGVPSSAGGLLHQGELQGEGVGALGVGFRL